MERPHFRADACFKLGEQGQEPGPVDGRQGRAHRRQATGLMSRPMTVHPSLCASPTVVPLPMKGSKITGPGSFTALA